MDADYLEKILFWLPMTWNSLQSKPKMFDSFQMIDSFQLKAKKFNSGKLLQYHLDVLFAAWQMGGSSTTEWLLFCTEMLPSQIAVGCYENP